GAQAARCTLTVPGILLQAANVEVPVSAFPLLGRDGVGQHRVFLAFDLAAEEEAAQPVSSADATRLQRGVHLLAAQLFAALGPLRLLFLPPLHRDHGRDEVLDSLAAIDQGA